MSRRRGRVFSYLAAYVLGLVLGLVCHIGDSSVAGNQLRSSRMLEFLAVLALLVPCTNQILDLDFMKKIKQEKKKQKKVGDKYTAHKPMRKKWP